MSSSPETRPRFSGRMVTVPLPVRPRPRDGDWITHRADDGRTVLLAPAVLAEVRRIEREHAPDETGGMLFGRFFADSEGPYAVVSFATAPEPGEVIGEVSTVQITASGAHAMAGRAQADRFEIDVVGWYHTHPLFEAYFSGTDRHEQGTWASALAVGLVVAGPGCRREPYKVYVGPDAAETRRPSESPVAAEVRRVERDPGGSESSSRVAPMAALQRALPPARVTVVTPRDGRSASPVPVSPTWQPPPSGPVSRRASFMPAPPPEPVHGPPTRLERLAGGGVAGAMDGMRLPFLVTGLVMIAVIVALVFAVSSGGGGSATPTPNHYRTGGRAPAATGKSATGKSATGKSATGKSATGKSATGKSATGKSATGKSATGKSATGKSATDKLSAMKP